MTPHPTVLRPLREQGTAASDATDAARAAASRLGQVIRRMDAPPVLPAARHEAILRRLLRSQERGRSRVAVLGRPALAMGIVLSVVLLGLGAHAAISWVRRVGLPWAQPPAAPEPAAAAKRAARHAARPVARREAPDVEIVEIDRNLVDPEAPAGELAAAPAVTPAVPPAAQRPRVRAGASGSTPAASPPAAEPPSSLAQESRLLGDALTRIRTGRDYAQALAILRDYDARFPNGTLRGEAALAELDALMALGQTGAALRLLEEREIRGPRAAEVLVVRGELRAGARRYRDAIEDFDRALARPTARLEERALYGRASCRARLGDATGSTRDIEEYLSRFPSGAHAAELRRKSNR